MIVIGGFGCCGTTAVCEAMPRRWKFVVDLDSWDWRNWTGFIKTHSLPPRIWPDNMKVVWCFGNPMDMVISATQKNCGFLSHHCFNLHGDTKNLGKVFEKDILGLDKHFEAWYNYGEARGKLACVKYEKLYSHWGDLEAFLLNPVNPSPFRPRATNWRRHWMKDKLQDTYGELAEKIDAAESFRIT